MLLLFQELFTPVLIGLEADLIGENGLRIAFLAVLN